MIRKSVSLIAAATLTIAASAVSAQDFPTRAITIIVPYAPGATDTLARTLGEAMSQELGQPVVVETRPGAGGTVGANSVAGSAPDGYTLLLAVSSVHTVAPHQRELPYGFDDLQGVARVATGPNAIAARPGLPFDTMEGLVEYARENPDEISYGSAGTGGATHIAAEAIAQAAGIELFHIPFGGVTPAIAATVAGDVDLVLGYASALMPQVEAGTLVALAQLNPTRASVVPDMPTLIEAGVDLTLVPNIGIWAPAGTPDDVIARLSEAAEKAASSDSFQEFGRNSLTEIDFAGSAEFAEILSEEDAFYSNLLSTIDFSE